MTVFFDVDTQLDFLFPAGALYVPGAETLLGNLAALTAHAARRGIPIVSTADAHTENDPEFASWPPHCVAGTHGQQKAQATLAGNAVIVPAMPAAVEVRGAAQIVIEKRSTDCFTNPNLRGVLKALDADRALVYGVVTEICVRNAVLGLLDSGIAVDLVTDAVRHLDANEAERLFAEVERRGERLLTTADVTGAAG